MSAATNWSKHGSAESHEKERCSATASPLYTSKIIKASALLDDTKTLLSRWDADATVPENLDRVRRENVFGKASRSRVQDIIAVFRQRYLVEADVIKALVALVKNRFPAASLDRVLYFHAARADALLHDAVTEVLIPMQAQGVTDIDACGGAESSCEVGREGPDHHGMGRKYDPAGRPRAFVHAAGFRRAARCRQQADRTRLHAGHGVCVHRLLPQAAPAVRGQAAGASRLEAVLPEPGTCGTISSSRATSTACSNTTPQARSRG